MTERSERVERLCAGYDAFRDGGIDAIVESLSPDIEVRDRDSAPDRETHHGWLGIRTLLQSTMEAFDQLELEPREFIEVGDRVAVVLKQRVRGKSSGAVVEGEVVHVWKFVQGRAIGMQVYASREKALSVLGLAR